MFFTSSFYDYWLYNQYNKNNTITNIVHRQQHLIYKHQYSNLTFNGGKNRAGQ